MRIPTGVALLLLVGIGPLHSAANPPAALTTLQARSADREIVLLADAQSARLQDGTETVELPATGDRLYEHLATVEGGWLASGSLKTDLGTEIFLLAAEDGEWRKHVVPGGRLESRWGARPLVEQGRLGGLLWVEGESPLTAGIRYSDWTGEAWTAPEWISAPGGGSQLGAALAPLPEGGALAIWTAFDGEDDEVVYSVRADGEWSTARRLSEDNAVPDITPSLAPLRGGAVAAWSTYDGNDYRVRLARFQSGEWSSPIWLGGPGSVFPLLLHDSSDTETAVDLLFRNAGASTWSVGEVTPRGKVTHIQETAAPPQRQPIVRRSANGDLHLEWPDMTETR